MSRPQDTRRRTGSAAASPQCKAAPPAAAATTTNLTSSNHADRSSQATLNDVGDGPTRTLRKATPGTAQPRTSSRAKAPQPHANGPGVRSGRNRSALSNGKGICKGAAPTLGTASNSTHKSSISTPRRQTRDPENPSHANAIAVSLPSAGKTSPRAPPLASSSMVQPAAALSSHAPQHVHEPPPTASPGQPAAESRKAAALLPPPPHEIASAPPTQQHTRLTVQRGISPPNFAELSPRMASTHRPDVAGHARKGSRSLFDSPASNQHSPRGNAGDKDVNSTSQRQDSSIQPVATSTAIKSNKEAKAPAVPLQTQHLLYEGYYVVSDGSANSSFSDTPRSAPQPASLCSSNSLRTPMQALDSNAAPVAVSSGRRIAPRRQAPPPVGAQRYKNTHSQTSRLSSSSSSSSDGSDSGDLEFHDDDDYDVNEDARYDEEDEEQAVLNFMDSGADLSHIGPLSGSSHLASLQRQARRAAASGVGGGTGSGQVNHRVLKEGDDLDEEAGLDALGGFGGHQETQEDLLPSQQQQQQGRVSVNAPSQLYRRMSSSSIRNTTLNSPSSVRGVSASVTRDHHVPAAAPSPSALLSRQHSTAAAPVPSRRSPLKKTGSNTSPQTAPLHPHLLLPQSLSAAAEEEALERQCKHLSLYEAFFFNQSRSFWLVDDNVLAKVLEYVRLMNYEHPALKRDRSKGQPSLWSSSSAVSSPIVAGKPKRKKASSAGAGTGVGAAAAEVWAQSSGEGVGGSAQAQTAAPAASTTTVRPHQLKSGKPRSAGQYANTTSTSATHLFFTFAEAMRWILEQEYVIGTVLMCCARFIGDAEVDGVSFLEDGASDSAGAWHPRRAMLQRGKPCIPVRGHPIQFVASLIQAHYPRWGGMPAFVQAWEAQIRLVLGSAAPSHQRVFKCLDDGLLLSSDVEAGNLHRVERAPEPYFFLIWLEPDDGSDKRIWFRFSVTGAQEGRTLRFRLMNAAPHAKLYRQNGMMPVWRDGLSQPNWGPVDTCTFRTTNHDLDGEVSFSLQVRNSTETIQLAFCAPYSYADLLCHVCHWHALVKNSACDMRFEERVLCRSPEGRKLHLLIVTNGTSGPPKTGRGVGATKDAKKEGGGDASGNAAGSTTATSAVATVTTPGVSSPTAATTPSIKTKSGPPLKEVVRGPYSNFSAGKKVILVSGRVHPGEVTASHGVHGMISFLLSSDRRAAQLREHFIFFIVPMLNPDGVSRGHSRLDQYGNNLNRCYNEPEPETQPTVLALRRVFDHLQHTYRERFIMYLDFHSHASQSSGFIFGNHLPVRVQHWNLFFPRLVELHARHVFSFGLCRFGRVHMTSKDGASRVLFGSCLIHSYTVELTHFTDRRLYADDFMAMNSGSDVLFAVTWPPMPYTAGGNGLANAGEESECENSRSGGGLLRPNTPCMTRGAGAGSGGVGTPRLHYGGSGRSGGAKRSNSAAATQQGKMRAGSAADGATTPRIATASSPTAGAKLNGTLGRSGGAAARRRGASASIGASGVSGSRSKDSASKSTAPLRPAYGVHGPALQPVLGPSVLCQSAEVGRACLLALLDYCCIGPPSDELGVFGGLDRVLRDVRRHMKPMSMISAKKQKKSQAATTYTSLQPIFKQY